MLYWVTHGAEVAGAYESICAGLEATMSLRLEPKRLEPAEIDVSKPKYASVGLVKPPALADNRYVSSGKSTEMWKSAEEEGPKAHQPSLRAVRWAGPSGWPEASKTTTLPETMRSSARTVASWLPAPRTAELPLYMVNPVYLGGPKKPKGNNVASAVPLFTSVFISTRINLDWLL